MKHLVIGYFYIVFLIFLLKSLEVEVRRVSRLALSDLLSLGDRGSSLNLLGALGDEHRVDVGQHTTAGDGHTTEELVELLVIADCQLDVAGYNAGLLVVASCIASKLKDLSSEVLKDGGQVDGSTGTDTGGELALLQKAADTGHRELKSSLGRLRSGLLASSTSSLSSFSFSTHLNFTTSVIDSNKFSIRSG